MKTFLVTAAVIFSISAHADDVKYSFPCGSGVGTNLANAMTNASQDLMNNLEKYTRTLKAKNDVQSVAVTSTVFKQTNWLSSEATLCATVAYKEKRAVEVSSSGDGLHYAFPCGIGYHAWANVALNYASQMLSESTEKYVKKIAGENFEAVKVAGSLASFNDSEKVGVMCSTVTFKGLPALAKEAAAK